MRLLLPGLFITAVALQAQTPAISVQPGAAGGTQTSSSARQTHAKSEPGVALPSVGFVLDASGVGIVPIRGTASAPILGQVIPKPDGVNQIFLPPRQHYALVEQTAPESMAVWHLAHAHVANGKDLLDTLSGVTARPDLVAFSPKASSAALYSAQSNRLQVVSGLPGRPAIKTEIPIQASDRPAGIALSDDGQFVVTTSQAGAIQLFSNGNPLQNLSWIYSPLALTFVPNTHSLVISDSQHKQLILVPDAGAASGPVVLGSNLAPDHLSATSNGDAVIALDAANQKLWEIDTKAFSVRSITADHHAETLIPLHDGHTFLLSQTPLFLLNVPDSASAPKLLAHPMTISTAAGKQ